MPARAGHTARPASTPSCEQEESSTAVSTGPNARACWVPAIARLMREAGLIGASRRRRGPVTTQRDKEARPAPDLVDRDFTAAGPNQLGGADITYVPTAAGFLYLALAPAPRVLPPGDRCAMVVGWARTNHLRADPRIKSGEVLDALEMAVGQRRPPRDVIHHSDQGSQCTSLASASAARKRACARPWGRWATPEPALGLDPRDNARCESFFATLECELLDRRRFASQAEARLACFSFIEEWYNPVRLHSALGCRSPIHYEDEMHTELQPAKP